MKRTASLFLLFACAALAHDLYLMPSKFKTEPGEKIVISVHNGDSFPGSEGTTDPLRLKDARLSDGTAITDFRILGKGTHGLAEIRTKGVLHASLRTEPKLLEMPPAKFEAYLAEEGLTNVIEFRKAHGESGKPGREMYAKYARSVIVAGTGNDECAVEVGLEFEIVPQANAASLRPGDKLPLLLLFRGKPLAGAQVEKAWTTGSSGQSEVVGRTDEHGRIAVDIQAAGKWRLNAVTMERLKDQSIADWQSFWTSLTFEVRAE